MKSLSSCAARIGLALCGLAIEGQAIAGNPAYLNVTDYGSTGVENADVDDSVAIQKALNDAAVKGSVVVLPAGDYVLKKSIAIPPFVTLRGSFSFPPSVGDKGTHLIAYVPSEEDGPPLISLEGKNSTIEGLRISYKYQSLTAPVPFPWTIRGKGDDSCVKNVCLLNSWRGIDLMTQHIGRHFIDGVSGQPLNIGIVVDNSNDLSTIRNIHFWPYWGSGPLLNHTMNTAVAMQLYKSDWQIVENFFCFGYNKGIELLRSKHGSTNGQFTNVNIDGGVYGIYYADASDLGVHISNLNIASNSMKHAIYGKPGGYGTLEIRGGSFWGHYSGSVVRWESFGNIMISASTFHPAPIPMPWPAIHVSQGRAMIQGNYFWDGIGTAVRADSNADRVMVVGNQLIGNRVDLKIARGFKSANQN